jgi:hypothetical protein
MSGFITAPPSQGMLKLQPTNAKDFERKYDPQQTLAQKLLGAAGRMIATGSTSEYQLSPAIPPRLYQPHNCWPWVLCEYRCGHPPPRSGHVRVLDVLKARSTSSLPLPSHASDAATSTILSARLPGVFLPNDQDAASRRFSLSSAQSLRPYPLAQPAMESVESPAFGTQPQSSLCASLPQTQSTAPSERSTASSALLLQPSSPSRDSICDLPTSLGDSDISTNPELIILQNRLEHELLQYRNQKMPLNVDGRTRRINPFHRNQLIDLLASIVCNVNIPVQTVFKNVAECEEFVLIVSTVEGVIGDLARHCIALEPFLVEGRLSIFVSRVQSP